MSGVETRTVGDDEAGMRLDRWFKTHYPALAHGRLEKLLRKGQIRVNGRRSRANRRLKAGETVRIPPLDNTGEGAAPARAQPRAQPREGDRERLRELMIYEDDAILALNKPFGLAVQGGAKTTHHIDAMLAALQKDTERPRLVHRLDRDTGGLLLVAKTRSAAASLAGAFQRHEIEKTYWALAAPPPRPREGRIDFRVAERMTMTRSGAQERMVAADGADAKKALTDFQTLDEAAGKAAFIALRPITGRKHQLRVHCAAIGSPIVGDRKYGGPAAIVEGVAPKLHLFCRRMDFVHPKTGAPMSLTAPLTGHMAETWAFFAFDEAAEATWPGGSGMTEIARGGEGIKRFWKTVAVEPSELEFAVALDGRIAKTPARNPLASRYRPLAEAAAAEWAAVEGMLDPAALPFTRLLSTVIDKGAEGRGEWRREILNYHGSDLLAHRADAPAALVERQDTLWTPFVARHGERFGAEFAVTTGIAAVNQPPELTTALSAYLEALTSERLLAAKSACEMTGSAVLAIALLEGDAGPDTVFAASRLDETFQRERWGEDGEAMAAEASLRREFDAVTRFLGLLTD